MHQPPFPHLPSYPPLAYQSPPGSLLQSHPQSFPFALVRGKCSLRLQQSRVQPPRAPIQGFHGLAETPSFSVPGLYLCLGCSSGFSHQQLPGDCVGLKLVSRRPGLGCDQGCRGLAWTPAPPSPAFLPSPQVPGSSFCRLISSRPLWIALSRPLPAIVPWAGQEVGSC